MPNAINPNSKLNEINNEHKTEIPIVTQIPSVTYLLTPDWFQNIIPFYNLTNIS